MPNIVYVLTNAAMPGLVKIGMTDRPDVQQRMRDLYTTGTPLPFDCVIAWELADGAAADVEQAFHTAFGPHRINPAREFFQVVPEQVVALMRVLPGREVTPLDTNQTTELPPEEQEAAGAFKRRQSQTNESEFLEAVGVSGRRVYERVLSLGKQDDNLAVRWGRISFTVYHRASGAVVCRGWPYELTPDFDSLRNRANLPPSVVEVLEAEAEQTNLFVRRGKRNALTCLLNQEWEDPQLTILTDWLRGVSERVREYTTEHDREASGSAAQG